MDDKPIYQAGRSRHTRSPGSERRRAGLAAAAGALALAVLSASLFAHGFRVPSPGILRSGGFEAADATAGPRGDRIRLIPALNGTMLTADQASAVLASGALERLSTAVAPAAPKPTARPADLPTSTPVPARPCQDDDAGQRQPRPAVQAQPAAPRPQLTVQSQSAPPGLSVQTQPTAQPRPTQVQRHWVSQPEPRIERPPATTQLQPTQVQRSWVSQSQPAPVCQYRRDDDDYSPRTARAGDQGKV